MPTITIESEQYRQLETIAQEQKTEPDSVVREALRRYFWEQSRLKISQESAFYRQHHSELKQRYLGQYIAMHQGQVVDHDADFQVLYQRVRGRIGKTPVMLTQVKEEPETTWVRRGFRSEQ
jgi:hypothetical protein